VNFLRVYVKEMAGKERGNYKKKLLKAFLFPVVKMLKNMKGFFYFVFTVPYDGDTKCVLNHNACQMDNFVNIRLCQSREQEAPSPQ
jgi:hypothetical protein